jgi:hypothetical protein
VYANAPSHQLFPLPATQVREAGSAARPSIELWITVGSHRTHLRVWPLAWRSRGRSTQLLTLTNLKTLSNTHRRSPTHTGFGNHRARIVLNVNSSVALVKMSAHMNLVPMR